MFAPVYAPSTDLRITGPVSFEKNNLKNIMEAQLSYEYWPVTAGELAANIQYNQIKETTLDMGGGLSVTSKYLNHTILCLGYRIDYQDKSIALIFDHEPFRNLFSVKPDDKGYDEDAAKEGEIAAAEENEKIRNFIRGADIVVHDTQYIEDEYLSHIGWGHATFEHAVTAVNGANVKKLVFFHHDPAHTDKQLKQLEKKYSSNSTAKIIMAKERMTLEA
jgi:ribonuclease BN (tRNA processing enzyme)